jgi:hypothetical protein
MDSNLIFLDIETAPGLNKPKPEDIKAPGNYKDPEKILAYQVAAVDEAYRAQSLNSMKGEIICIGASFGDEVTIINTGNEAETMLEFTYYINKVRGQYLENLQFIGWNILTFDIPWLWRKAIQHNLPALRDALPKEYRHFVTDLMKIWASDFKDLVSLASVAEYLGIEHKGGKGSEICDLWLNGDMDAINSHCQRDIETVMAIYKRMVG